MSATLKYKLIRFLARNDEALVMYYRDGDGGGFMKNDGGLPETIQFLMERSDAIKDFIVNAACEYLRKYEVQKQEFAKKLYNQEK